MAYSVPPSSEPSIALFSKSAAEPLATGVIQLGFNTNASYNSPIVVNNYTSSGDNSTFTIAASGLYQVEICVSVLASTAGWSNNQKNLNIVVTRGGVTATIAGTTVNINSAQNYNLHDSVIFPFLVGDVVQFQHGSTITSGTQSALGTQNGFDLNTWCVFQYLKAV